MGSVVVGILRVSRHATGQLANRDQRARHLTAIGIAVGVAGDEQILPQRQRRRLAEDVERLEQLRAEEPAQHLIAADPREQRDQLAGAAGIKAGGLHRRRDEGVMRGRGAQILREQRPRAGGVPFRERQEREIPPRQRGPCVGDHGAQSRHPPARADQRRGGRVLPALQLRDAERRHMRMVEKGACPLESGEEPPIDFGDYPLERFGFRPARQRQRFPPQLLEIERRPRGIERARVARAKQSFEGGGEGAQPGADIHRGEVIRPFAVVHTAAENPRGNNVHMCPAGIAPGWSQT